MGLENVQRFRSNEKSEPLNPRTITIPWIVYEARIASNPAERVEVCDDTYQKVNVVIYMLLLLHEML
jgi:hypothetical protein